MPKRKIPRKAVAAGESKGGGGKKSPASSKAAGSGAKARAAKGSVARKGAAVKRKSASARAKSSRTAPTQARPAARGLADAAVSAPPQKTYKPLTLTLRTKGAEFSFKTTPRFEQAAMQWTYVLRNRRRWVNDISASADQAARCRELFEEHGVGADVLEQIAEAEVVEVSIPFAKEEEGWEARIFPWEHVLCAATREFREGKPLSVIRHLVRRGDVAPARAPKTLLFVESAPGGLRNLYDFDAERELVKSRLSLQTQESTDETSEELSSRIKQTGPDVIHLAGTDTHQACGLKILKEDDTRQSDGYVLRSKAGEGQAVSFKELPKIINAADNKPTLVACSIYNSGARIAAMLVAGGADAAIGFQDEFDDTLAEIFFTNFYHAWRLSNWSTLEAFNLACVTLRAQPHQLRGTGVVLWSARSLLGTPSPTRTDDVEKLIRQEKMQEVSLQSIGGGTGSGGGTGDGGWGSVLKAPEIKPVTDLNYSMLHNNSPIFEQFVVKKIETETKRVGNIRVEVELLAGGSRMPYETSFDLMESRKDLAEEIRVPLTYSIGPAVSETIFTSLYVKISVQGQEFYRNTYRVSLPPLDEWRDNKTDGVWLPSFVLPRDPAVYKIIDAAQRYLMALRDDSSAGFDGYQSLDPEADDEAEGVDLQVQAIWSALIYDMSLSYINPPPAYYKTAQRLRTPTAIVGGRRGTCIDLALLLASCLEYVDILPAIFLLKGHAFPAYWRNDADQEAFRKATLEKKTTNPNAKGYYFDETFYGDILEQVRARKLVPIESTWLTSRGSFWEAIDEGIKNLRSKPEFDALLDIRMARGGGVTPIPLHWRSE